MLKVNAMTFLSPPTSRILPHCRFKQIMLLFCCLECQGGAQYGSMIFNKGWVVVSRTQMLNRAVFSEISVRKCDFLTCTAIAPKIYVF